MGVALVLELKSGVKNGDVYSKVSLETGVNDKCAVYSVVTGEYSIISVIVVGPISVFLVLETGVIDTRAENSVVTVECSGVTGEYSVVP